MDSRIRMLLRIITESAIADHPSPLSSTSQMLGLSESHLRRLFKREVGVALQGYLRTARMSQAAKLACDHKLSIKQIALRSGYDDISNFYRDFKRVHGQTPRRFRTHQLDLSLQISRTTAAPSS